MKMTHRTYRKLSSLPLYVACLAIAMALVFVPSGQSMQARAEAAPGRAAPDTPMGTGFTYQGQLKSGGNPANGQYDLQFKLYDALTGGTQVGTTQTVTGQTVAQGLFTVQLDFGANAFRGDARWLEIAVRQTGGGTYTTLSPRQPLTAVPYAMSLATGSSGAVISSTLAGPALVITNTAGEGVRVNSSTSSGVHGIGCCGYPGIYGQGDTYGVYGSSSTGFGVGGYSDTSTGVFGRSDGVSGIGVSGTSTNGKAIYGSSSSGYGLYGTSQSGTGAYGSSSNSNGVAGSSSGGNGVYGSSQSGTGVYGYSVTGGYGVYGSSTNAGMAGQGGTYGVAGNGTSYGVHGSSTNGTGVYGTSTNSNGVYGISSYGGSGGASGVFGVNDNGTGRGVLGSSSAGIGVKGQTDTGSGLWGVGFSGGAGLSALQLGTCTECYAIYATSAGPRVADLEGDVVVNGWVYKSGGSFRIDDPLDPENKYLLHSFVESPDMMNVYNGNATTDASGEATVALPDYFEALNKDYRYQLTPIGQFAQAMVSSEVKNNRFTIKTDKPNVKVSWQVTGIRKDPYALAHPMGVEVTKPKEEQGTYLYPEGYGQPASKGVNYEQNSQLRKEALRTQEPKP